MKQFYSLPCVWLVLFWGWCAPLCSEENQSSALNWKTWFCIANHCLRSYAEKIASLWFWGNEFKPELHNYLVYLLIFDFLREGHQTEFRSWVVTTDRMAQRMVMWILDQEVVGSRLLSILCFFIYRFTGDGVEFGDRVWRRDKDCRLGSTKVHFINMECYQSVENYWQAFLIKF